MAESECIANTQHSSDDDTMRNNQGGGTDVGLIIGIVAISLVAILGGIVIYLWCQKNKQPTGYGSAHYDHLYNKTNDKETPFERRADQEL